MNIGYIYRERHEDKKCLIIDNEYLLMDGKVCWYRPDDNDWMHHISNPRFYKMIKCVI